MYEIANYEEYYQPLDKSGRVLQNATYVKLPVNPKGDGIETLLEDKKGLEVFAIWCLLLEKATAQKPELRGKLLNHKDESATAEEIAKGILLKKRVMLVEYALNLLVSMGWLKCDIMSPPSGTSCAPKSSVIKSSVEESRVEKSRKKFIPPTQEEVRKYITENPKYNNIDPKVFWDYFNSGGWVDSKGNAVKNWKQKLITWSSHDNNRTANTNRSQRQKADGRTTGQIARDNEADYGGKDDPIPILYGKEK